MVAVQTFFDSRKAYYAYAIFVTDNGDVKFGSYKKGIPIVDYDANPEFLAKYALASGQNPYKLCGLFFDGVEIGNIFIETCTALHPYRITIYGVDFACTGLLPSTWNARYIDIDLDNSFVLQSIVSDRKLLLDILSKVWVTYNGLAYRLNEFVV